MIDEDIVPVAFAFTVVLLLGAVFCGMAGVILAAAVFCFGILTGVAFVSEKEAKGYE